MYIFHIKYVNDSNVYPGIVSNLVALIKPLYHSGILIYMQWQNQSERASTISYTFKN